MMCPPFEHNVIENDERIVVFRDGGGVVRRSLKDGTSMDQYMEFPVKDRSGFLEMKKRYDPRSPTRYPSYWEDWVRCYQGRDYPLALTGIGGFGFYSMLRRWMGTENACTIFYDDPTLAEEMLDFLVEFFTEVVSKALNSVDVDWYNYFEDFAFKAGPLVSPQIFKRFLLPRYRRINDYLRGYGIDIISLDSDGNIEILLPMIIESGINNIVPLEQAAGMDAVRIRREYGTALTLWGSIDKRELAKGRKGIEQELLRQVPTLLETGGYIPTVDHAIPPDVSYDNFRFYLELKAKIIDGRY
jgi:uroporphyrinogen decarboxylase